MSQANFIGTLSYSYDFNGNVTSIQSSTTNGTSITYRYDALNRLSSVIDARLTGAQTTKYGYDLVGNLASNISPNTITNLYRYDSLNRLTNLTAKAGTTILGNFGYLLVATGNRTNLGETVNSNIRSNAWTYDALYRLTNEVVSGTSPAGSLGYRYDDVGNRTNRIGSLGSLTAQTIAYDTNDELTTDIYDKNGNTTTNSTGDYRYDFENHLTNYKNREAVITYDGDGNRVSKEVGEMTTLYLVDTRNPSGYAQVLEELTVSGSNTNLSRAYTYGTTLISQRTPGGAVHFYGLDGHGSVRFLTDVNASVTDTYAYDAFGNLIGSTGTSTNNHLYSGEESDPDLNLYYQRARYMNVGTGRFWTMDTTEGNQEDPLSRHEYLYVKGDPIDGFDPTGHDDISSLLTTISVLGTIGALPFSNAGRGRLDARISGAGAAGQQMIKESEQGLINENRMSHTYEEKALTEVIDAYITVFPDVVSRSCGDAESALEQKLDSMISGEARRGDRGITFVPAEFTIYNQGEPDNIMVLLPNKFTAQVNQLGSSTWYNDLNKKRIIMFYAGSIPLNPVFYLYYAVSNPNSPYGKFKSMSTAAMF